MIVGMNNLGEQEHRPMGGVVATHPAKGFNAPDSLLSEGLACVDQQTDRIPGPPRQRAMRRVAAKDLERPLLFGLVRAHARTKKLKVHQAILDKDGKQRPLCGGGNKAKAVRGWQHDLADTNCRACIAILEKRRIANNQSPIAENAAGGGAMKDSSPRLLQTTAMITKFESLNRKGESDAKEFAAPRAFAISPRRTA